MVMEARVRLEFGAGGRRGCEAKVKATEERRKGREGKQALIAREGLSAGLVLWCRGGAPRSPAPPGGGVALGCAGAAKACGFEPMGALRPEGVGRRSD